ncbi:MAG: serpin family protein [Bacteroides sp.]|nr:serpin family protein [Bacteroides sp.]
MKKILLFPLALLLLGWLPACKQNDNPGPEPEPVIIELSERADEVIGNSNQFGIELFTQTVAEEPGNMMLSPLSASIALTMALNGSAGETYAQMYQMLGYPGDMTISQVNGAYQSLVGQLLSVDPKVKIALANALFYRLGFVVKPPYLQTMEDDFDAHVEGLDFSLPAALATINGWASDNTFGKIPEVLQEISPDAVMFLMNALYFKGDWTYQFDENETIERPFHLDDGTDISVPTMAGNVGAMRYVGANFNAIELPYGQTNFSMVVLVPNETLEDFYPGFTPAVWDEVTSALDAQAEWIKTDVLMPKFEFDYEKILNDQLKGMGMLDAFIPVTADFSGITDEEIFISFVKQNTYVMVNEEGTEAAAVTTIGFENTSVGPGTPFFYIDKPFVFAIRERTTNTLLFIGSVTNPMD